MNAVTMQKHLGLILGVLALLAAAGAQATTVPNWTWLTWDSSSGMAPFQWDQASVYPLSQATQAKVEVNEVPHPVGSPAVGTVFQIWIPNFVDPLPLKTVDIYLHSNTVPNEFPAVWDVKGFDSNPPGTGPVAVVDGTPNSPDGASGMDFGTGTWWQQWIIQPNPDFEFIKLYVPAVFELSNIEIHTVSTVPVPPAVWLLGSALVGLVSLGRRRSAGRPVARPEG